MHLTCQRDVPVVAACGVLGAAPCPVSIAAGRTSGPRRGTLLAGSGVCHVSGSAEAVLPPCRPHPAALASWGCGSGDPPWGCHLSHGSRRHLLWGGGNFSAWSLG